MPIRQTPFDSIGFAIAAKMAALLDYPLSIPPGKEFGWEASRDLRIKSIGEGAKVITGGSGESIHVVTNNLAKDVSLETNAGNVAIAADSIHGLCIKTNSGDVRLDVGTAHGEIRIITNSADVRLNIRGCHATFFIQTNSGNVTINSSGESITGDVKISTNRGKITIDGETWEPAKISSNSGSIQHASGLARRGHKVTTTTGKVLVPSPAIGTHQFETNSGIIQVLSPG